MIKHSPLNVCLAKPSSRSVSVVAQRGKRQLLLAMAWAALLFVPQASRAVVATFNPPMGAPNPLDLTDGTNYSTGTAPNNATDILFDTGFPTAAAIFQLGTTTAAANLAVQSLNDTNANAISIGNNSSNTSTTAFTLTIGNPAGQTNAVTGAAPADLIYVGGSSTLTLQKANLVNGQTTGKGTMAVTLAQSGNFNVAGTLTVNSNITGTGLTLTKTGAGTLTLAGTNVLGNLVMNAGTLTTTAGTTGTSFTVTGGTVNLNKGTVNAFTNAFLTGGSTIIAVGTVGTTTTPAFGAGATIYLGDTTPGSTTPVSLTQTNATGGAVTTSNNIVVQAGTTGTISLGGNGGNNGGGFSGNITLNNALTLLDQANNNETFSGQITGSAPLTISSTGGAAVVLTGNNSSSLTSNFSIAGILGFGQNSLGTGTLTLTANGGFLWSGTNTLDISGRLQPLTGSITATLNLGANNVTFANGLSTLSTNTITKNATAAGILTLAVANPNFLGTYTTATTGGTTLLTNANALQNATVSIPTGTTTGGVTFDSSVTSHAFNIGALTGPTTNTSTLNLADNAANPVALTVGGAGNAGAGTFAGVISGGGSITKAGAGTLTLTGANTYTGVTTILGGGITLNGAGSIANTPAISVTGGTLTVDNTSTLTASRLGTGAIPLTLSNGTYSQTGRSAPTSSASETVGTLTLDSGANSIFLQQGTGASSTDTLTAASLVRSNNATLFVRGTSLGQFAANGGNGSRLTLTAVPTGLIGGGGTFTSGTSPNISIIPYMVGGISTLTSAAFGASTFVGYDATTGSLRALKTTEFGTSLATATTSTNVRLSSNSTGVALPTSTVNALVLDEATTTGPITYTIGVGGLTLQSGALLFSKSAGTAQTAVLTGAGLSFGTTEGVLTNGNGADVQINSILSGTGGVTFSTFTNPVLATTPSSITLNAANTYSGQTTINGTVRTSADNTIPMASTVSVGQGGVLDLYNSTAQNVDALTGRGTVDLTSGGGFATLTIGSNNGTGTFTGAIQNSGASSFLALAKTGTGTQVLTGASTFAGGTTVSGGSLLVNNTAGSGLGSGNVMVGGGTSLATFGGNGTVTGAVTFSTNNALAPGAMPGTAGTLTVGLLTLTSGTTLVYDLGGVGTNSDLVRVNGDLTLAGTVTVNALPGFGAGNYELFGYTGVLTGNTLIVGSLPAGYTATVDTTSVAGQVLLDVTPIPEPGTWALLGLGGIGLLAVARRRRAEAVLLLPDGNDFRV